jgi:N6-L-threonylcarbamoyladenine synthase
MKILGIETSCDETGIAIVEKTAGGELCILSNILATSLAMHASTGGIIPENAAREQLKFILPTLEKALFEGIGYEFRSNQKLAIDAIAVTYGPGLIGSLLVGVECAKTLSYVWNIPIIPVNHMHGHVYANWLMANGKWQMANFPAVALVVSGGHTDLLYMKDVTSFEVIGGTRDDAAGEAFDKIGRLLGISYPAGARISKLAETGDPKAFSLPRPMIGSNDLDFSFSGLKTSVLNLVKQNGWDFTDDTNKQVLSDLCASVQEAVVAVLVRKTMKAAKQYHARSILVGGGVSANTHLRQQLDAACVEAGVSLFYPTPSLSTDNGAMIAAAGFFQSQQIVWQDLTADPELYY